MPIDAAVLIALGSRLLSLRSEANLSQRSLAAGAGVNLAPYQRLEHGLAEPRWSTVTGLANALGLPVGDLAGYLAGELPLKKISKKIRDRA